MTVLTTIGDSVKGERITCFFRKRTDDVLISGTHRHRMKMIKVAGLPAEAIITKPFKFRG